MGDYTHHDWAANTPFGQYLSALERDAVLRGHRIAGQPGLVLDVGAAGGRWSALLRDRAWKVICTDVNARSIAHCAERMPNAGCHLVSPDDTNLPCEDQSVGMILCIEVFAVISQPWFTSEVARVLKPNGLLVGEFNNKQSWRGYLHHLAVTLRGGFDYYNMAYPKWTRNLCLPVFACSLSGVRLG